MGDAGGTMSVKGKVKEKVEEDEDSDEEVWNSEEEDETIARIQRAHFAQAAAMNPRRKSNARPRAMSHKRKMEAVRSFHDFTKKLKKDTGIRIRSLVGNNILELSDFSSEDNKTDSDGLSEEEFSVDPSAVHDLDEENESYIDPETGDIVESKRILAVSKKDLSPQSEPTGNGPQETPKTLSISDIINEGDLDLSKNVEIAEVEEGELCTDKTAEELLNMTKQEDGSSDFDLAEKLKEMEQISITPVTNDDEEDTKDSEENKPEIDEEKKLLNSNTLNVRRNIRDVMDEKNLDASTLAAQRQESERLARVQEQQRIIREVQRQIAINRQNKIHQKTLSLLQGGSSLLKKGSAQKLNLPNTVLVKLPSGELKKTTVKQGQVDVTKISKPITPGTSGIPKSEKKEVVEIVDSSSGEESSSSSSDSDDCIMLSDSEVPPSPEAEEDPGNSGLHVNDAYNIPDEQGRVLINIGHAENEEDIFLAPQIARVIKPHQIGGVRFLFDNIIESVQRFSTSTGFGCILAHSMGLGKTLQIVCFCDIFLRHTNSKTVLCIMPINTLQNWVAEFNMWLPVDASISPLSAHGEVRPRNFPIYVLNDSHKTLQMRAKVVKDWTTTGGVLMIGYELYRLLSMKKDKKPRKKKKAEKNEEKEDKKFDKTDGPDDNHNLNRADDGKDKDDMDSINKLELEIKEEKKEDTQNDEDKKLLDEMYDALVKPGPDLVICDEGHRIKNSHSNISYALKQMRTKRRVVLTGYPLQNNLLEYWCMVDFVRPNYLGSKTEFCNMFERPIQNGQCIDSTPQDIRLMRYRAHVLHSLLVGFVQRRSHAVLQSTLPQKEEYVLLVRMTPLQRKLYDRFMNEVVRSASVPNPLKAFAICCKIWNHPDVLYNFLRKRSEVNAAIEEDLDLEEIGGVTKAGRARNGKATRRAPKTRGSAKKPAATIPPNTTGSVPPRQEPFANPQFPTNTPYGPTNYPNQPPNRPEGEQSTSTYQQYPPYQNSNPGYFPPNQGYNQEYSSNFYQQQQQPYDNNYSNQYPPGNSEGNYPNQYPQGNNQTTVANYWGNSNYYGNQGYYGNQQYGPNQTPSEFNANQPPGYNNTTQYPPNYNAPTNNENYTNNSLPPYANNQENYGNQNRSPGIPYQGGFPNNPGYSGYNPANPTSSTPYRNNQTLGSQTQEYPNQSYPSTYSSSNAYEGNSSTPYNQYGNQRPNYSNYSSSMPPHPTQGNVIPNQPQAGSLQNQRPIKTEPNFNIRDVKTELNDRNSTLPYSNPYNYQQNSSTYPGTSDNSNSNYNCQFPNFPQSMETKSPLCSASSGSPVTSWPLTETIKTEVDKLKAEEKQEIKSESDGEVKIEDLDTKKIVKDECKKGYNMISFPKDFGTPTSNINEKKDSMKGDVSESEVEHSKKGRKGKNKDDKKTESKQKSKGKAKAKGRKDRKNSKEKNNDDSDSEESEKEEKPNKEEELALTKKAEEMTYDWATELLKDYIPGIIENSSKMELFFYILNESIKLGDRLLLFSQSLFTLNLIEDFLERNYIPGTNRLWERNTSYYRLDGSTHALEREKLINEFNANPHVHLFLVSTRAGSLGINLVGANRVIVFDASWNPCHDTQAVCRVYRYGQKKPCFVYRFVMDCCLEKKIYDRQINKQGMADRVVDECNPDAVLSMKEITNLCFDNDEKEPELKDLSEHKDKYIDVLMQGIISLHGKLLCKEPFQHESLLVDRKEKKLSSAEKRLAQRGYELEKKAASAPKPTTAYRTVRTADGSLVQRPVASVRPMQHGARWIPADVWRRQGMTAQEMTLPIDVVIPTNSAEKTNIVLKAGQRVMVLKSPKGIYMQLESGKIIAIKTSFKGLGGKGDSKDNPVGKKILGSRPNPANIPGSLKNNSAITITSKTGPRPYQRVIRPSMNKIARPMLPGQKIVDIRSRLGEMRSYSAMRAKFPMSPRMLRPTLPKSLSITKISKDGKRLTNNHNPKKNVEGETQVLDSDDEEDLRKETKPSKETNPKEDVRENKQPEASKSNTGEDKNSNKSHETDEPPAETEPIILTTDEKIPSEEVLENRVRESDPDPPPASQNQQREDAPMNLVSKKDSSKISQLKNYRHQRICNRPPTESSLSQLEKTASSLNKEGLPDFRRNLDDITQSYSPGVEDKVSTSRKKKSPSKVDIESQIERQPNPSMTHSVSSLLGSNPKPRMSSPIHGMPSSMPSRHTSGMPAIPQEHIPYNVPSKISHGGMLPTNSVAPEVPLIGSPQVPTMPSGMPTSQYVGNPPPETAYPQYPGYGMSYGGYPNTPYYPGYGGGYYPPYAPAAGHAPYTGTPPAPTEPYLPPNPQW
nr:helicase ARIP4 [Danaus plexippus plexippus]